MEFDFPLGPRRCIDGITRRVFIATDGRQFIVTDHGKSIFGSWLDNDHDQDNDHDKPAPIVRAPRP
jgi:hypothetical protein